MSTRYYQKNKERLQIEARERYQNLSEVEKDKKCQYRCERHKLSKMKSKGYQNIEEIII